ncbi:MAG TPA: glycosyltransferase family 9 protein [Pyrinomonadaceae bacterium]|jgi:predicted lipopolysaccharide heptosyltransferase III
MNSLRETIESSPRLRELMSQVVAGDRRPEPQPLAPARWDWRSVGRVLVVRLRSIGDTVLTTPSLIALRRFLPQARIDILLEEWIAPVLEGFDEIDRVITFDNHSVLSRARVARELRAARYDVVYNLHGGTTATLLTRASGAKHRVGFAHYQFRRLHNHLAPSSAELWGTFKLHSVEQQLALIGWTGVPVTDRPPTRLAVTADAAASVTEKLRETGLDGTRPFAIIHPAASYETKQWAVEKFARIGEELAGRGLVLVAIAAPHESAIVAELKKGSGASVVGLTNLSLPEITALAARARLFVGNDSGIAHIAAAAGAPSVVIFGSSNVTHWRPWTLQPNEIVREELPCQPCHGYFCAEFEKPECILRVPVERVVGAIDRVLRESV